MNTLATLLLTAAAGFIEAPGFTEQDITQSCNNEAFYTQQRFPQQGQSVFNPDADLDALTKAVLLIDCAEGSLPHARYLIRYHLVQVPQVDDAQRDYIEVLRFNLGPQRYQDVIQYVDQEFWPPESIFGVGPNLAWRFVFGPVQGNRAHIERASRTELSPAAAAGQNCLGTPCLSVTSPPGPSGAWRAFSPPALDAAVYHEPDDAGLPGPARMTQMLLLNATGGSGQAKFSESASIKQPEMVFLVSKNIEGQDSSISGLLHQRGLMDDAISELWTLLRMIPETEPEWHQKAVYRTGRQ